MDNILCYRTEVGYFVIIHTLNELLEVINELGSNYTFGLSETFPEKNHIQIFMFSHDVCKDDRVGEIIIPSIDGEFDKSIYSQCELCSISSINTYW